MEINKKKESFGHLKWNSKFSFSLSSYKNHKQYLTNFDINKSAF